ncbi:MAG: competence protein ComEC family protein [Bacteroidales bacterium]|nr:competence protein ComEC family protein [Bacteroidales bacterium]
MQISPLIKLAISLIIGISTAQHVYFSPSFYPTAVGIGAFLMILILLIKQSYRNKVYHFGLSACVFMALLGFLRTKQVDQSLNHAHFSKQNYSQLIAVIDDTPSVRERSVRTTLKVIGGKENRDDTKYTPTMGKIMAYIAIDSLSTQLRYGDVITIRNRAQTTDSIKKFGNFDFRKFLKRKQIFHTIYLNQRSWQKIDENGGNPVRAYAIDVRDNFLETLSQQGITGAEYAVTCAILLGYGAELTPEIRKSYQNSGTVHILSVSGLHVGLFAMVVMHLLFFLRGERWKLLLKAVIVLTCIWSYALITGFAPSALRSAIMFTFITIGKCVERQTSVYNSLATSAIVQLTYDPMMLYALGFQFSYLAVLGIVMTNNMFSKLWTPKNKVSKYVWECITVSIAAQLSTTPLSIFYFNQFPNYFILANIIASPLSVLIIPLGMAILVSAQISAFLAGIFGKILNYTIWVLNQSVSIIEWLPLSVWRNLNWSKFETVLAYLAIAFLLFAYFKRRRAPVWTGLACLVFMVGMKFFQELNAVLNVL